MDFIHQLCSLDGVGKTTAERLFAAFGAEVLEVLSQGDAAEQLRKVPKIGKAKAAQIKASWDSRAGGTYFEYELQFGEGGFVTWSNVAWMNFLFK